ncbi:large ribosomal subunit protein mL52 isoform X2 [Tiliqua scincoides]|uniref:large ribosomal subunit protein mL52 isoform X2 n=1 Tax=Tiliqua scincoides TaxID=71010 RepID=UPI0034618010
MGPQLVKFIFASRSLHCSTADQAGGAWRVRHGLPVNPSILGPMTDLPDWSFADGRPAPPMKGQLERQEKNKEFARRVAMISAEMDRGIERWEARQREQKQQAEEKKHQRLQPKGSFLQEHPK